MITTDNTRGHLHVHSAVFFVMKDLWPTFVIANKFTGKLGFFHYVSGIQHSMEKAEGCEFYLFCDPCPCQGLWLVKLCYQILGIKGLKIRLYGF